jgi:hypothetical protein
MSDCIGLRDLVTTKCSFLRRSVNKKPKQNEPVESEKDAFITSASTSTSINRRSTKTSSKEAVTDKIKIAYYSAKNKVKGWLQSPNNRYQVLNDEKSNPEIAQSSKETKGIEKPVKPEKMVPDKFSATYYTEHIVPDIKKLDHPQAGAYGDKLAEFQQAYTQKFEKEWNIIFKDKLTESEKLEFKEARQKFEEADRSVTQIRQTYPELAEKAYDIETKHLGAPVGQDLVETLLPWSEKAIPKLKEAHNQFELDAQKQLNQLREDKKATRTEIADAQKDLEKATELKNAYSTLLEGREAPLKAWNDYQANRNSRNWNTYITISEKNCGASGRNYSRKAEEIRFESPDLWRKFEPLQNKAMEHLDI